MMIVNIISFDLAPPRLRFIRLNESEDSIIVYHGSNNKFDIFNDSAPIFFVDDINIAKTYGDYIIKAKLDLDNPLDVECYGNSTIRFMDKWYLPSQFAERIKDISNDIKNRYALDDETKDALSELGYDELYGDMDGIIMRDINDANNGVFNSQKPATNYVVFDKNKVQLLK